MDKKQFYKMIEKEETMTLATENNHIISMRTVSPALYNNNIIIFTGSNSNKYNQLKENPNCCIQVNNLFVQAKAEFMGDCMLNENKDLRKSYDKKFPRAFDEETEFGGRTSEFISFHLTKVTGWNYENGMPTSPIEIEL